PRCYRDWSSDVCSSDLYRGRLDEIVPLEPASMPDRVVVQWDKDDCADLGIIKIDLLGLGMMAVLEQAIPLVRAHEGVQLDLAQRSEERRVGKEGGRRER